jgi:flagellar hook assembly protein FlgD
VLINEDLVVGLTYFDDNLENGTYVYKVTAIYDGGEESDFSNTGTVTIDVVIVFNPPHSLEARAGDGVVNLQWSAPKEHEMSAEPLNKYNIYRNDVRIVAKWDSLTYTDTSVINGTTYTYKVTALYEDDEGVEEYIASIPSNTATATPQVVSDIDMLAVGSRLHGNYPNPFNPVTTLRFTVDSSKGSQHVAINIYNIRGQLVRSLVYDDFATGDHTVVWNGTDENGRGVSSGIYFYRMTTENYSATRKMILMK